ncbi:hypothetical protein G7046_g9715 [Stylonectria norvegica]|nr:hypothetical protein G7046_g9715 [Stylonectria norvegica]
MESKPHQEDEFLTSQQPINPPPIVYEDGLHVVHDSGLEVAHPGVGAYHNPSNLPEVSPSWGQTDKANQGYGQYDAQNQQSNPYDNAFQRGADGGSPPGTEATGLNGGVEKDQDGGKILGMRKKIFFIVLAVAILLVVIAIAVGLGVGLAMRHSSDSDSDSDDPKSTDTPSSGDKIISTATANITCPASDNTTYQAEDTGRYFRIICAVDYNSDGGSVDLSSKNETSMAECIDACTSLSGCTAAGWGNFYDNKVCFMKKSVGSSVAVPGWIFTKEVDKPDDS